MIFFIFVLLALCYLKIIFLLFTLFDFKQFFSDYYLQVFLLYTGLMFLVIKLEVTYAPLTYLILISTLLSCLENARTSVPLIIFITLSLQANLIWIYIFTIFIAPGIIIASSIFDLRSAIMFLYAEMIPLNVSLLWVLLRNSLCSNFYLCLNVYFKFANVKI